MPIIRIMVTVFSGIVGLPLSWGHIKPAEWGLGLRFTGPLSQDSTLDPWGCTLGCGVNFSNS